MRQKNWQITAYSKPEMVNIQIVSKPYSKRKRNLYSESDSNTYKQDTTNQLSRGDIVGDNRYSGKAEIAKGQQGEQALVLQRRWKKPVSGSMFLTRNNQQFTLSNLDPAQLIMKVS